MDAILLKVLEAVPFQLTTDGGVEASRQRFRDPPRRLVHPDVRTDNRTIDGPAGPIPIRVYSPPTERGTLPVVSSCTVADGRSATSTPTTGTRATTRSERVRWWCRWTTGWHPSTYPRGGRRCLGRNAVGGRTPRNSAPTPTCRRIRGLGGRQSGGGGAQLARDAGGPPIRSPAAVVPRNDVGHVAAVVLRRIPTPHCSMNRRSRDFPSWYVGDLDLSTMPATLAPARADDLTGSLCRRGIAVAATTPARRRCPLRRTACRGRCARGTAQRRDAYPWLSRLCGCGSCGDRCDGSRTLGAA